MKYECRLISCVEGQQVVVGLQWCCISFTAALEAAWRSRGKHTLILSACGFSHDTLISSHGSETDSILLFKWSFHFQIASCRVSDRLPWPEKKKAWALPPGSEQWNSERLGARLSLWPPSLARSLSWFRVHHKAPEANPGWRWDHAGVVLIKHL